MSEPMNVPVVPTQPSVTLKLEAIAGGLFRPTFSASVPLPDADPHTALAAFEAYSAVMAKAIVNLSQLVPIEAGKAEMVVNSVRLSIPDRPALPSEASL